MRLLSCQIAGFGKLVNQAFDFSKDLVEIKAENGWGKTTLATFLESMLFGLGDTRAKSVDGNERIKYEPFQGGYFGGSLTFSHGGKIYRIERKFGKTAGADVVKLYDKNNMLCYDFGENIDKIGETLLGVNRESYRKSAYVPQGDIVCEGLPEDTRARLTALLCADHDIAKGKKGALERLEEAERALRAKRRPAKGKIDEVEERLQSLATRRAECERATLALQEERADFAQTKERLARIERERKDALQAIESQRQNGDDGARREAEKRLAVASAKLAEINAQILATTDKTTRAGTGTKEKKKKRKKKKSLGGFLSALSILSVLVGVLLSPTSPQIGSPLLAVGCIGVAISCLVMIFKAGKGENAERGTRALQAQLQVAKREVEEARLALETLQEATPTDTSSWRESLTSTEEERNLLIYRLAEQKARLEEGERQACEVYAIEAEYERLTEEKARLERRLEAVRTAKELLLRARGNMAEKYLEPIESSCREYARLLGESVETRTLRFNADGAPFFEEESGFRALGYYSVGTKEFVGFCTRLALAEAMFAPSNPPVLILDDPFVNFDDKTTAQAKKLVKWLSKRYQVLYFTCKEERRI